MPTLNRAAALRQAAADPDLAVVVTTGAGRAFSAGQDLAELDSPPARTKTASGTVSRLSSKWWSRSRNR